MYIWFFSGIFFSANKKYCHNYGEPKYSIFSKPLKRAYLDIYVFLFVIAFAL